MHAEVVGAYSGKNRADLSTSSCPSYVQFPLAYSRRMPEPASGLWRSQDMVLLQLHMQREAAHDTIFKLGQLGCVQFRDMNPGTSAFQRLFTGDVRRCEESERRLRYFEDQLKRAKDKGPTHVTTVVDRYVYARRLLNSM